ncbi:MAG TPA: helix-turn-helix domain-containing protein [Candidatus Dormibacteraeota bacterium]|nr:helix-turn-helix domain-containing protein [Candidatus Dormibacteraeota bacterium]
MTSAIQATNPTPELRELSGVTLKEAAEVAGVAASTMWAVEHGRSQLTKRQMDSLTEFYAQRFDVRYKRVIESLKVTA